jgi:uncharacterized protein with HEPN domain
MSKRSEKLLIEDIIESIERVFSYTEDLSYKEFIADNKTVDAVVRNFEVIGEASNNLPKEFLPEYPQIDWSGLIGFRNKLIHGYFGVDYKIVWYIIETELEGILSQFKSILENHSFEKP